MRNDIDHFKYPRQLKKFADKVDKLKAEGLSVVTICKRLSLPRSTFYLRLRMWEDLLKQCTCDNLGKINPEFEGCVDLDCPAHNPPLQPGECDCYGHGTNSPHGEIHMRESLGCEFEKHHCDDCHQRKSCTAPECK